MGGGEEQAGAEAQGQTEKVRCDPMPKIGVEPLAVWIANLCSVLASECARKNIERQAHMMNHLEFFVLSQLREMSILHMRSVCR